MEAVREALRHELTCSTPPPEFVSAMRGPSGAPRLVCLALHGRKARVVVHPIGIWSPTREAAAWDSITRYVHSKVA
ncbi:hypothetical protein [Streptosporangium longisporum]|uniref:hypothetical protein n=1 Tax=Streptosporangium longisporum TaxID=46187 RepID=UPI0031EDBE79